MEFDRELLRDRAYLIKSYALRIVANAEKIEAASRSRAKPESIANTVNDAAGYIQEYLRLLGKEAKGTGIGTSGHVDERADALVRKRAASCRAEDKEWAEEDRASAPGKAAVKKK